MFFFLEKKIILQNLVPNTIYFMKTQKTFFINYFSQQFSKTATTRTIIFKIKFSMVYLLNNPFLFLIRQMTHKWVSMYVP